MQFGPFYLFDLIGRGGMAEIFLSKTFTSLGTERLCVIKRILSQLSADDGFCSMLIQEAKLASRLSHRNVVQTYDLGRIEDQYYISMEYVEGVDLNRLLGLLARARIALPLQFALYIIVETLRGLDYAHRLTDADGKPLDIIHCDVSPTNVLISTEGEVKLCDFGIAKAALSETNGARQIDDYHLKGKVAYMAPEHVAGERIDRRADLFSAGILLWELLSGRRLYKTKDEDETLRRAESAEIPPLAQRGFPRFEELGALVSRALERNRDDRFQSGGEFIEALESYMHSCGMIVSQLRFADFLMENFGEDLLRQRRERERNLSASIERLAGEDEDKPSADVEDPSGEPVEKPVEPTAPPEAEDPITRSLLFPAENDEEEKPPQEAEIPDEEKHGEAEEMAGDDLLSDDRKAPPGSPTGSIRLQGEYDRESRPSRALLWIAGLAAAAAAAAAIWYYLV
ncbi:MAG: protein kinase [Polyangia bacterium]